MIKKPKITSKKTKFSTWILPKITLPKTVSFNRVIHFAKDQIKHSKTFATAARKALKDPAKANFKLGMEFLENQNHENAALRFWFASLMQKDYAEAYSHLGESYIALFKFAKAQRNLEKALALKPDLFEAKYFLNTLGENPKTLLPNKTLIKKYFNGFAQVFDQYYIEQYQYKGHELIASNVRDFITKDSANILELGSGAGHLAKIIKAQNAKISITGIDFCKEMVSHAATLKNIPQIEKASEDSEIINLKKHAENKEVKSCDVYDMLINKDFNDYAKELKEGYDAIVMRGFLNYAQDLNKTLKNASSLLAKNAYLIFYITKPYSTKAEQEIIKDASFPFYLKSFPHEINDVENAAKKLGLKKQLSQEAKLDKSNQATIFVFQKS
jgi:predicted TPR repeat methyltransferase